MSRLTLRSFQAGDQAAVFALPRSCGWTHPANDSVKDIARKLRGAI